MGGGGTRQGLLDSDMTETTQELQDAPGTKDKWLRLIGLYISVEAAIKS